MNTSAELFTRVLAYQPALLSLGLLCFAVLIQAILTAPLSFVTGEQEPGMPLRGGYADRSFRVLRTHANSVENLGPFIGALLLAIIAGVDSHWVNGLAGAHLAFRLFFWTVYYGGIGKSAGGPRTLAFIGGWLTNTVLAGMTIYALLPS